MAILPDLSQMSADQLRALVAAMASAQPKARAITCRVSAKGALSIYGLGQFPVTLYLSQFDRLNEAWPDVQSFVAENRTLFTVKGATPSA